MPYALLFSCTAPVFSEHNLSVRQLKEVRKLSQLPRQREREGKGQIPVLSPASFRKKENGGRENSVSVSYKYLQS